MKVKKTAIIIVVIMVVMTLLVACRKTEQESKGKVDDFSVQVGITIYSGTYAGELKNGIPDGKGIFKGESPKKEKIKYEGKWKEGEISGNGALYKDDKIIKGKFEKNLASGEMTIEEKDGSYSNVKYNKGVPTGFVTYYNRDGKYESYDYYYRNELLSNLVKNSLDINYQKLFDNEERLKGKIFCLEGNVESIEETDSYCKLKIKDKDGRNYLCQYQNTSFLEEAQTIAPKLKRKDEITLYGYYLGISLNSIKTDTKDYGFSFPQLDPFYITKSSSNFDRENPSFSYQDILQNAYYYYQLQNEWSGKVDNVIIQGKALWIELEIENGKKVMVISPKRKWKKIPVSGDFVDFSGYIKGYYKKKNVDGLYQIYPYIQLKKIL